jgi:hypothetical protein
MTRSKSALKRITDETRCEKCALILISQYEEDGASWSAFHQWLKITVLDKSQNRFGLRCPNCEHTMVCILTVAP